jgi:hypothetical protein
MDCPGEWLKFGASHPQKQTPDSASIAAAGICRMMPVSGGASAWRTEADCLPASSRSRCSSRRDTFVAFKAQFFWPLGGALQYTQFVR